MRMSKRDSLSRPSRIEAILAEVAEGLEVERDQVVSLLQAASTFERRGSSSSRYSEELLKAAVARMSILLEREGRGRVSLRTFVDNYLRVLSCPEDIKEMLESGEVTLFEALQLKRLSLLPEARRRALIEECRQKGWIAHRLRAEIDALLKPAQTLPQDFPEFVSEHCRQLLSLLASTDCSRLTEQEREELLAAIDGVILKLQRLGREKPQVVLGL